MATESPARPLSGSESPAQPLSQWLQLMLAEIAAKREALERTRAEEAQCGSERPAPVGSRDGTPST
jgi:hypothetical protein